jgi:threonine dehydratase
LQFIVPSKSDIVRAHEKIKPYINETPVMTSQTLDQMFGCHFLFKCENFQKAGAFKSRGAVNAVFSLSKNDVKRGVATHSSGNHAQALARAARLRGVKAYMVMPDNAPRVKVEAVKEYGGEVFFCEPTLEARETKLKEVIRQTGAVEIHPYDHPSIIEGQATAAKELLADYQSTDLILAPVGGGGLLSGTALSASYFGDHVEVIGCEPAGADDAQRSFRKGEIIPSKNPDTLADGLLTSLGKLNFLIIKDHVKDIVTVSEEAILMALQLIWERMKIVVEPSSAVPLAALIEQKIEVQNKTVGVILSGGNIDLNKIGDWFDGKR